MRAISSTLLVCAVGCTLILGERPDDGSTDLGVGDLAEPDLPDAGDVPDQAEPPCGQLGSLFRDELDDAVLAPGLALELDNTTDLSASFVGSELVVRVLNDFNDLNVRNARLVTSYAGDLRGNAFTVSLGGDGSIAAGAEIAVFLRHEVTQASAGVDPVGGTLALSRAAGQSSVRFEIVSTDPTENRTLTVPVTAGERHWRLREQAQTLYLAVSADPVAFTSERNLGAAPSWVHSLRPGVEVRVIQGTSGTTYTLDGLNLHTGVAPGGPHCSASSLREIFGPGVLSLPSKWSVQPGPSCAIDTTAQSLRMRNTSNGTTGNCDLVTLQRYDVRQGALVLHAATHTLASDGQSQNVIALADLAGNVLRVSWSRDSNGTVRRVVRRYPGLNLDDRADDPPRPYLRLRGDGINLLIDSSNDGSTWDPAVVTVPLSELSGGDALALSLICEWVSAPQDVGWELVSVNVP